MRELEPLLHIPVSMIRRELQGLAESGLFTSRKRGNLVLWSLNKKYPLFEELKSIVFKTIGAKGLIKETLERVKGIKVAFLYGSFARSEERDTSDVDLFLMGMVDERKLVVEIGRLENVLRREINHAVYSPAEFLKKRQQHDAFIMDVLKSPKILLIGEENDLR